MTEDNNILSGVPAAEEAAEALEKAVSSVEETADAVAGAADTAVKQTEENVEEITEVAEKTVGEITETVEETAGEAAEAAEKTVDEISENAEKAAAEITEAADEATDGIKDAAQETAEAVAEPVPGATGELKEGNPADHFKTIISAAEHSAEVTAPKPAGEGNIFFEMPTEKTDEEIDAEADKAASEDEELAPAPVGDPSQIMEDPPVIVFDQVYKEYEGQIEDSVALTGVSFSIRKGEFVFIVGPSGSGKSTMIRLMMREISPSSGKILIAGKNLAKLRRRQISKYRRNIGIVFQDFRLLPDRNVYDNVAFAQRVVGAPKRNIPKEVSKVLHLVGLSQKYKSFPNELSGGEQQRVAIARALVNNPMIILADEPTGNLDPKNSYEIMSLLEEINRRGTTVVIVTHDSEVVNRMQKRVVSLQSGTIVDDKRGGYKLG